MSKLRYARRRTDVNQQQIVDALRTVGATVVSTHAQHAGFPDLVVGWRGVNILMEVKRANGKLSPPQQVFFRDWQGQAVVVRTPQEALDALDEFGPDDGCGELGY